jgi:hypothetical protein
VDNPILAVVALCALVGGVLGGLSRLVRGPVVAGLVIPVVFLAAYVATYQQVPSFPPVGSVNKIFYIALAAALLGLAVDRAPVSRTVRRVLDVAIPIAVAGWIAAPRLTRAEPDLLIGLPALWLGGALVLWRLDTLGAGEAADGGSAVATALLATLALGFAPVALAGASSTSLMLCLALFAGWGAAAVWELAAPRDALAATALFGGAAGLLAVVDTVVLITRHIDVLALLLLLPVLACGQIGARLLLRSPRFHGRARAVLVALVAAAPIPLVAAVLLLRHPDAFAT